MVILIHGPPEVVALAVTGEQYFVYVPCIAWSGVPASPLIRMRLPEGLAPLAHGCVGDDDPGAHSSASTSPSLRQKRTYHHTLWLMISACT